MTTDIKLSLCNIISHQKQHYNCGTEIWIIKQMEFQKLEVVQTSWVSPPGFIRLVLQTNSNTTLTLKVTNIVEDMQGPTKYRSPLTRLGRNSLPQLLLHCWGVTRTRVMKMTRRRPRIIWPDCNNLLLQRCCCCWWWWWWRWWWWWWWWQSPVHKVWNKINGYLIFLHVDQLFNHFGDSRFWKSKSPHEHQV